MPSFFPALRGHVRSICPTLPDGLWQLSVVEPADEDNDLRDHELRDTPRIAVRRIENRDTAVRCRLKVNLIGADAVGPHDGKMSCMAQHLRRKLSAGTDAEDFDAIQRCDQIGFAQAPLFRLDFEAGVGKRSHGTGVNIFEKEGSHWNLWCSVRAMISSCSVLLRSAK